MIDTVEKAKSYGRLTAAIQRITTSAIDMDEAAIEDLARRVEAVADSIVSAEYKVGDEIEFNYDLALGGSDCGNWRRDRIAARDCKHGANLWLLAESDFLVGPSEMRKVPR